MHALVLCFEAALELKVNLAKYELFVIGQVTDMDSLVDILGLPLEGTFKAKGIWDVVIQKIE